MHVAYPHMAHGPRRHDLPSVTPNNQTSALFADGDDHIQNAVHLNCADDDQAITLAKEFADRHDVELWQLDRKVATFPKVLKKG